MDVFKIINAVRRFATALRNQDWNGLLRALSELTALTADLFGPKPMTATAQRKSVRDAQKVTDEELDELTAGLDSLAPTVGGAVASGDPEPEPVELDPATIALLIQLGLAAAKKLIEWIRKRRQK